MKTIRIPKWLGKAAADLVDTAEKLFPGKRTGGAKKRWVAAALKEAIDIKGVPDAIEDLVIDLVIEITWSLTFERGA